MRSITLSFYAQFVVLGMVYYGISFGADKLGVNPFVYMAVNGVVEIPSGTVTIPLVDRLGRRLSCTLSFVITAGSLMVLGFIPSGLYAYFSVRGIKLHTNARQTKPIYTTKCICRNPQPST